MAHINTFYALQIFDLQIFDNMVFECCEIYLFQLPFLLLSAILCFYLRIAEIYDGNSSLALFLIDDFLQDGLHQMHPHKIEIILFDSVPVYAIDRAELIIEPEWYETNPIIFLEISIQRLLIAIAMQSHNLTVYNLKLFAIDLLVLVIKFLCFEVDKHLYLYQISRSDFMVVL